MRLAFHDGDAGNPVGPLGDRLLDALPPLLARANGVEPEPCAPPLQRERVARPDVQGAAREQEAVELGRELWARDCLGTVDGAEKA
eukprot:7624130-Pyramimonas_sp.AAC.1